MRPLMIARTGTRAVALTLLRKQDLGEWLKGQPRRLKAWVKACHFGADAGEICLVPDAEGGLAAALAGVAHTGTAAPGDGTQACSHWDFAGLPAALPEGAYRLDEGAPMVGAAMATRLALGWALGAYAFTRYRRPDTRFATLVWPQGVDRGAVTRAARATFLVRDLVNTPAAEMGPSALASAARSLARRHAGRCTVIVGDALIARNYPAIHTVGRASTAQGGARGRARAPRLIDLRWGRAAAPRVTLVGKGVCFDTGGLNIKPDASMKLMKKDMGGAAHVLGLASMIMEAALDVRLRVLIPAVENSVSGDAMRPLDVIRTRKGLTVEIGHTDAEGRLVLCDALAEAAREKPDLLIDVATLTGAARAALGTDLPALFCNDDGLAGDLLRHGAVTGDPLWRMPLWRPYRDGLESRVADLSNVADGPYGGAITAALFLSEFVDTGIPWVHLDIMAWNVKARPGRPVGGEAMGMRALFAAIRERVAVQTPTGAVAVRTPEGAVARGRSPAKG